MTEMQQVALLDMLDMSWYNGCPLAGPLPQKLPYYDGIKKSRGLYDSFKKSPDIYKNIPLRWTNKITGYMPLR